jgi:DNA-binding MarR family transcriptional regulator
VVHVDDDEQAVAELGATTLALRGLMNASRELLGHVAREAGVNATDMTALDLLDVHGPMGAAELARRLGIRSASATTLIDRLEQSGHVVRVPHPHDRRRVTVVAQPAARAAGLAAWLPAIRSIDEVGSELTDDESRVVERYLTQVSGVMEGIAGPVARTSSDQAI